MQVALVEWKINADSHLTKNRKTHIVFSVRRTMRSMMYSCNKQAIYNWNLSMKDDKKNRATTLKILGQALLAQGDIKRLYVVRVWALNVVNNRTSKDLKKFYRKKQAQTARLSVLHAMERLIKLIHHNRYTLHMIETWKRNSYLSANSNLVERQTTDKLKAYYRKKMKRIESRVIVANFEHCMTARKLHLIRARAALTCWRLKHKTNRT